MTPLGPASRQACQAARTSFGAGAADAERAVAGEFEARFSAQVLSFDASRAILGLGEHPRDFATRR